MPENTRLRLASTRPIDPPRTDCNTNPRPARLTALGNVAGAVLAVWLILAVLAVGTATLYAALSLLVGAVR